MISGSDELDDLMRLEDPSVDTDLEPMRGQARQGSVRAAKAGVAVVLAVCLVGALLSMTPAPRLGSHADVVAVGSAVRLSWNSELHGLVDAVHNYRAGSAELLDNISKNAAEIAEIAQNTTAGTVHNYRAGSAELLDNISKNAAEIAEIAQNTTAGTVNNHRAGSAELLDNITKHAAKIAEIAQSTTAGTVHDYSASSAEFLDNITKHPAKIAEIAQNTAGTVHNYRANSAELLDNITKHAAEIAEIAQNTTAGTVHNYSIIVSQYKAHPLQAVRDAANMAWDQCIPLTKKVAGQVFKKVVLKRLSTQAACELFIAPEESAAIAVSGAQAGLNPVMDAMVALLPTVGVWACGQAIGQGLSLAGEFQAGPFATAFCTAMKGADQDSS